MSALIFADDRPTSCGDDLYQWAMDAEALIRNLHTENTALRVNEENLRQELQECQDQRRAAFRRIEELDAMRAQIGQGEPVAWRTFDGEGGYDYRTYEGNETYDDDWANRNPRHVGWVDPLYLHPAPQQKPLTDEQIEAIYTQETGSLIDDSPWALVDFVRAVEAAHNIGEKK